MSFPQSGGNVQRPGTSVAVASNTVREGQTTEITTSLTTNDTQRQLVYKFVPRFTGEYKVSVDLKTSSSSNRLYMQYGAVVTSTANGYSDIEGTLNTIDFTLPLGSVVTVGASNANLVSNVTVNTSSTTYVTLTFIIGVYHLRPIYFLQSVQTAPATVGAQNFTISYDLR